VHAFLADHRHELFPPELFADVARQAFEHLETHELIEAEDLNSILEQAKGITSQLPGT
jgi:hypothetical protein